MKSTYFVNNFYANILTPNISEKIQQLVNMKHNFNTDTDDEDIDNDEILEKLKDRNIFNDTRWSMNQILYQVNILMLYDCMIYCMSIVN